MFRYFRDRLISLSVSDEVYKVFSSLNENHNSKSVLPGAILKDGWIFQKNIVIIYGTPQVYVYKVCLVRKGRLRYGF